jgi:hypothetical protein
LRDTVRIQYLFDSRGRHIANLIGEQLHAPTGETIGRYEKTAGMFIDMSGNYLGEIVGRDRLLYNYSSSYRWRNYGNHGDCRNTCDSGTPEANGVISMPVGYGDVKVDW